MEVVLITNRGHLDFLFKDFLAVRKMIESPDRSNVTPSQDSINRQTAAARAVVDYCMNISDCRRVQLLQYFDEKFDKAKCGMGCDNCAHPDPLVREDVSKAARDATELVRAFQMRDDPVTLVQCRDILRGANTASVRNKQHDKEPQYGSTRDMASELLDQVLRKLCFLDVLKEKSIQQTSGYHVDYVFVSDVVHAFRKFC